MSEERQQILQMLQAGRLTTTEAMDLLNALEEPSPDSRPEETGGPVLTGDVIMPGAPPPNMARLRRFWQIPFFIALAFLLLTGLGLRAIYQSADGTIGLWFFCLLSLFIFAFVLTALAFLSRRAPWLHVRVRDHSRQRVAISLPLPLGVATWGLTIARGFVDAATREKVDMAATFVDGARENVRNATSEPLMITVDEEGGERIEIYLG